MRIATFAAPLSRDGPGLLLRDIRKGDDPQIAATLGVLVETAPDVVVLTDVDWDLEAAALTALRAALAGTGLDLPHQFTAEPNAGMPSRLDLDGNGRLGEPRDAQGYGRFTGDGGLAILSRYPVCAVQDLSPILWRDMPGATLPVGPDGGAFPSEDAVAVQRLSSTAHWIVTLATPGGPLDLMVWSATPPVFDGPEDRNGLRARDEARLWTLVMDGRVGRRGPDFVIAGNANLDPVDGEGDSGFMAGFLADPRIIDPKPQSEGARAAADPDHRGDPAEDTADWDGPGNLRVSYVLPSATLSVAGAGVFWPAPGTPGAALLGEDGLAAGPHRLVWLDIAVEEEAERVIGICPGEIRQEPVEFR